MLLAVAGWAMLHPHHSAFGEKVRLDLWLIGFYLVLGFVFFLVDQHRLLFVSFLCCGLLTLFFKSRADLPAPAEAAAENLPRFSIAHFDVGALEDWPERLYAACVNSGVDLISLQNISEEGLARLRERLRPWYSYGLERGDPAVSKLAIFSRYPLTAVDTFAWGGAPTLPARVEVDPAFPPVQLLALYLFPQEEEGSLLEHLHGIVGFAREMRRPLLIFGNMQTVSWSYQLQEFRASLDLKDSRRGAIAEAQGNKAELLGAPLNHILYSSGLKCLEFQQLGEGSDQMGIRATFQFGSSANR